jgi:hypothetical protein
MTIWTLSRSLRMPGTHRKVCPKCAHRVPKRRRANMKTAIYLSKHRHGIGAGGGTRTLFSYLLSGLEASRRAEIHNRTSLELTVTPAKLRPRSGHGRRSAHCAAPDSSSVGGRNVRDNRREDKA